MVEDRKPKFFYGYIVVAAGFIISLLIVGIWLSFGIFFKPLSSELGWTRATTSAAVSLALFVSGFFGIVAGRFTDRYGPKVVFIACGFFFGLGLLLMSQINALWQLYLFYGVMVGVGMAGADAPVLATLARWFVKRRGMVTGITKVGAGIGIMLISPLANWLIFSYDWRSAYAIIGIMSMVGIISAGLLYKRDPSQVGALPDDATEVEEADSDINAHQLSLREIVSTRQFWIFSSVWFVILFSVQMVTTHLVPHATDLGISATVAATFISTIGGASILGRIGMGTVSDWIGTKSTLIIALSFLATALVLIQFAGEAWTFYLVAIMYGIAHGAFFTLISPMLAELFGLGALGAVVGAVFFVGSIGGTISPVLAGHIFDITGSYQLAFLLSLVLSGVAIILMLFLRPVTSETVRKIYG